MKLPMENAWNKKSIDPKTRLEEKSHLKGVDQRLRRNRKEKLEMSETKIQGTKIFQKLKSAFQRIL